MSVITTSALDERSEYRRLVLCVEDEPDLRNDIAEELAAAGYEVVQASNGREALGKLHTIRPDLILCDVTMPELGGYELMAQLRKERPDLAEVPFIFLTALADRNAILHGKNAGADDYLVKPVDFDDLLATVRTRLRVVDRVRQSLLANLQAEQKSRVEQAVRDGEATLAALAMALDRLSIGIFLLEEGGQVRMINDAGHRLVEKADGLTISSSGLLGSSASSSRSIKAALTDVWQRVGSSRIFAVERSESRPLVMQVSSLHLPGSNSRYAVAFVVDPDHQLDTDPEILITLFGCTSTEARVASALLAGKRLEEIGEEFGVKQTTLTFHLQNLFQKTDTNRQADLLAMLVRATASFPHRL